MVNVTLCFSANQALLAAKAGATFISPFIGRLDDLGLDGLELIADIQAAEAGSLDPEKIAAAQQFQRRASFYVDYVEAENSSGFHAPQEAARILGEAVNFCRLGQLAVRDAG